ncbi:MAG: S8 family serine peptidase [Thermodesulfobacteriota bacterium]|nr:S8 family serine peptidase [Thermodesulfobacteriota bacterium]
MNLRSMYCTSKTFLFCSARQGMGGIKKNNLKPDLFKQTALLLILLLFAGCNGGGGGGGGGGEDSTTENSLAAVFSISPGTTGNAPFNTYFDASGSMAGDNTIENYAWDFGDGTLGAGQTLSHIYTSHAAYTVTLTVTDVLSNQASLSKSVVVTKAPASSNVGGKIIISSGAIGDSDTNDPNSSFKENDTFETAQQISSPNVLGGYVNESRTGAFGRSFFTGDRSDLFRVYLTGTETINLSFSDSLVNDLDLYLYNDIFEIVDSSKNIAGVDETIVVNKSGNYYIRVYAYEGASAYILTLGRNIEDPLVTHGMTLSREFVPGEAIVSFKKSSNNKSIYSVQETLDHKNTGSVQNSDNMSEPVLITLGVGGISQIKSGISGADFDNNKYCFAAMMGVVEIKSAETAALLKSASEAVLLKDKTLNLIKELTKRKDVVFAEPNFVRQLSITPSDPHYTYQWNYPLINLPKAWDSSPGSSSVITAVLDTGVLMAHPDMENQLTNGYDFISNSDNSLDNDGIDNNPDDPGDKANGSTSSFHGTHVAGIIGAASNNGVGVSGIAWNSKIMPLRVLGRDGGTTYDTIQALKYAAGLANDSGTIPEQRADIINMSFGSTSYSQAEQNTINTIKDLGIIMVAAAGNESTSQRTYPAAYSGVISVSAVTMEKKAAWYTNYGSWIDISAPGGDTTMDLNGDGYPDGILSTCGDDSTGTIQMLYTFFQGTSMAAPHVSGVFALMKSVYSDLDFDSITNLLVSNTLSDDTGALGRDNYHGYGLINAKICLAAATNLADGAVVSDQPALAVTPAALNFGSFAATLTVTAQNGGTGELYMDLPVSDLSWLTISPDTTDAQGLGTYLVTADRSGLSEEISYSGTITFTSTAGTIIIPVTLYQPGTASANADLGTHYIQLVNSETYEVFQIDKNAENGAYSFTFTDVPAGIYRLYAGNDPDNDAFIMDKWEAAAGYKTIEAPTLIYVNENITDLEFFTGYSLALSAKAAAFSVGTSRKEKVKQLPPGM